MAVVRHLITDAQLCENILKLLEDSKVISLDLIKSELRSDLNVEASPKEIAAACNTLREKNRIEVVNFEIAYFGHQNPEEFFYRVTIKAKSPKKQSKTRKK